MLFISKLSSNTSGIVIWRSHNGDSNPITKEEKMSEIVSDKQKYEAENKRIFWVVIFFGPIFLVGLNFFLPKYLVHIAAVIAGLYAFNLYSD